MGTQSECVELFVAYEGCKRDEKKDKKQWGVEKDGCAISDATLVELKKRAKAAAPLQAEASPEAAK